MGYRLYGESKNGYQVQQWVDYTQSIDNNTTTLTVTTFLTKISANSQTWNTTGTAYKSVTIDWNNWVNINFDARGVSSYPTDVDSISESYTFSHNADGTSPTITFTGEVHTGTTGVGRLQMYSQYFTAPTIPRATQPSAENGGSWTLGTAGFTISTPRASSGFYHKLYYSFGTTGWVLATEGYFDSYDWTPPLSLASQIPSVETGTGTILLETYSGGTCIGSKQCTIYLTVPSNIIPSASLALTPKSQLGGSYIQNKSSVTGVVTFDGTNTYGSTCAAYELLVTNSANSYSVTYTSGSNNISLPYSGDYTFKARVKDNRGSDGYSAWTTIQTITVLAYSDPVITLLTAIRCDANGLLDEDGITIGGLPTTDTYVKFTVVGIASPCNNLISNLNTTTYKVSYKLATASTYTDLDVIGTYNLNTSAIINSGGTPVRFSIDYAYDIKFTITDKYKTTETVISVASQKVLLDLLASGNGARFGGVAATANTLEVDWLLKLNGGIQFSGSTSGIAAVIQAAILASKPLGHIEISTVNTNPSGYLGGIWIPWGTGRVPVGIDGTQAEFNTVEKTGGDKNLQSHSHTTDPANTWSGTVSADHAHSFSTKNGWAGSNSPTGWSTWDVVGAAATQWGSYGGQGTGGINTNHQHTTDIAATTSSASGAGGSQNLQPYITCYMWKRTG